MRNLAFIGGLWVSLAMSALACKANRKGLGASGLPDGGVDRGGAGAGSGTGGAGGTAATGGAAASGGRDGTGGVTSSGGTGVGGGTVASGGAGAGGNTVASGGAGTGGNTISAGGAGGAGGGGTGGASASGGAAGSGGASGGTHGTGTGGASSSGGSTGGLKPCNSSDGTGCDEAAFCVDTQSDTCQADFATDCTGYCAERRPTPPCTQLDAGTACPDGFACLPDPRAQPSTDPTTICLDPASKACTASSECPTGFACVDAPAGRRCAPDRVACDGFVSCPAAMPATCPIAYARSTPDGCFGPCVPIELCACSTDRECTAAGAYCDRKQGRCYAPRSPDPRCLLPFDTGPCDAAVAVYAFIDGECKPASYGGCGGNDNRFTKLEECLARCQGMPGEQPCPEGRVDAVICLGCGGGGGCIKWARACAKTCTTRDDCRPIGLSCSGSLCEIGPCV